MEIKFFFDNIRLLLATKRQGETSYRTHLMWLWGQYEKMIEELSDEMLDSKIILLDDIRSLCGDLAECLNEYSHAQLDKSIQIMKSILSRDAFNSYRVGVNSKWYRGRIVSGRESVLKAEKMFHVPFEMVRKIGNARYSISGYPCLYLSNTVWGCWEELGEPAMDGFCTSLLKTKKIIDLLDLRLPDVRQKGDISKILYTLPLVIACSVEVQYPDDPFKPEYVLPQIVMLALVDNPRFMGCVFTSSKSVANFEWPDDLLWNIAMPVLWVKESGLCPKLANYFAISDSINYKYEILKCNIAPIRVMSDADIEEIFGGPHAESTIYEDYEGSIFGQLEKILSRDCPVKDVC